MGVRLFSTIIAEVNCSDLPIVYGYSAQLLLKLGKYEQLNSAMIVLNSRTQWVNLNS
jgi:hypothetical protein